MRDVRYAIFHLPGPAWDRGKPFFEQDGVQEHVGHYRRFHAEGKLEIGGPFLDEAAGGMMIPVAGVGRDELVAFANADPAVRSGLLRAEVREWLVGMKKQPATGTNREVPVMTTGTVRLHRVLRAPPERVYRAFLDPDAMVKWLPPHGFTGKVHHVDARVGGIYRMSFTNLSSGASHAFGGEYLELVPSERIVHTDRFDDANLPGEMRTTILFGKVFCGTELSVVQEGIPAAIPVEACYLGWQESLVLLAQLVEAEIPG